MMFPTLFSLFSISRRVSGGIVALLVLTCLGVPISMRLNGDLAIGRVGDIVPLGSERVFLRVQLPFELMAKAVVVTDAVVQTQQIAAGDWVLASGSFIQVEGRQLLKADLIFTGLDVSSPVKALLGNWEERLRTVPFAAVLIGCVVLIAGGVLATLATALSFAALCGALVWSATATTALAGSITLPPMAIYPIVATAAVTGLALGWRVSASPGSFCQRLMAVACLFALLPSMTAHFGWPVSVSYGLLIVATALPAVAYALIGALFLTVGLNAGGDANVVILAISACVVLIIQYRSIWSSARFATPIPKEYL